MSGQENRPAYGLRCRACARPFGFAVAFCPFCGAAQRTAAPAPPPAVPPSFTAPPMIFSAPAPPKPAPPPPAALPGSVPTVPFVARQAAATPPSKPAARKAQPRQPRPNRRRRSWPVTVGAIGVIAAAILLRPGPAGTVIVYPTPSVSGSITIDGKRAGVAGERLQVPVGTHRLGYEADGWTTAGRRIAVRANEQRVVTIVLAPLPATLVFDVEMPGVTLRLDDQFVFPQGEHRVAAGRHRLTATRPGYAPLAIDLVLARGEERTVPVALSPLPRER